MRDMSEAKEMVEMLAKETLGRWEAAPAMWEGDPEVSPREKLVERFVQQLDGHMVQFVVHVPGVGDVLLPEQPMRFDGEELADPPDRGDDSWTVYREIEALDGMNGMRMLHLALDLQTLSLSARWDDTDMMEGIMGGGLGVTSLHTEQATYYDRGVVKLRIRATLSRSRMLAFPTLCTMNDTLGELMDLGVRGEVTVNDGYIPNMASSMMDVVALTGLPQEEVVAVCQGRVGLNDIPYGTAVRLSQYASISHLRGRIYDAVFDALMREISGDGAYVVVTIRNEDGDRRFMYGMPDVHATMFDLMAKRQNGTSLVLEHGQQMDGAPMETAVLVAPWSQVHQVAVAFDDVPSGDA